MFDRKIILWLGVGLLVLAGCATTKKNEGDTAVFRIDCGAEKPYTDKNGNVWAADAPSAKQKGWKEKNGTAENRGDIEIKNTDNPVIYRTEKFGSMDYRFKVKNGKYKVVLHFAETYDNIRIPGLRVFSVSINGGKVLSSFDVFKETGSKYTALVKEFPGIMVANGELAVTFLPEIEEAEINGIEIYRE